MFILVGIAAVVVAVIAVLLWRRGVPMTDALDVGAVSTRWLAEIRRDEPWTRS